MESDSDDARSSDLVRIVESEREDHFYFKALLDELGMDDWLVLTQDSDDSESD